MRVRVLRSVQLSPSLVGFAGETVELDERWARHWVARGYVVAVNETGAALVTPDPTALQTARDPAPPGGRDTTLDRYTDRDNPLTRSARRRRAGSLRP